MPDLPLRYLKLREELERTGLTIVPLTEDVKNRRQFNQVARESAQHDKELMAQIDKLEKERDRFLKERDTAVQELETFKASPTAQREENKRRSANPPEGRRVTSRKRIIKDSKTPQPRAKPKRASTRDRS